MPIRTLAILTKTSRTNPKALMSMLLKKIWTPAVYMLQLCLLLSRVISAQPSTSSDFVVGSWQAKWAFADSTSLNLGEGMRYHMNGHFHFLKDGSLRLAAYGCPNCVMGKDTVSHELQWRYALDTLHLYNMKDQVQLSYQLQRQTKDTLYFVLMEEVELRLLRIKEP